jgi:hypothetical protein
MHNIPSTPLTVPRIILPMHTYPAPWSILFAFLLQGKTALFTRCTHAPPFHASVNCSMHNIYTLLLCSRNIPCITLTQLHAHCFAFYSMRHASLRLLPSAVFHASCSNNSATCSLMATISSTLLHCSMYNIHAHFHFNSSMHNISALCSTHTHSCYTCVSALSAVFHVSVRWPLLTARCIFQAHSKTAPCIIFMHTTNSSMHIKLCVLLHAHCSMRCSSMSSLDAQLTASDVILFQVSFVNCSMYNIPMHNSLNSSMHIRSMVLPMRYDCAMRPCARSTHTQRTALDGSDSSTLLTAPCIHSAHH